MWKNDSDMFKCLPLMGRSVTADMQLQFMYDALSLGGDVDIESLSAHLSMYRSIGMVRVNGVPMRDIEEKFRNMSVEKTAPSCPELLRLYDGGCKYGKICDGCPLSPGYTRSLVSDEKLIATFLVSTKTDNGLRADYCSQLLSQYMIASEFIPYSRKPANCFTYPLYKNIVQCLENNAFFLGNFPLLLDSFCSGIRVAKSSVYGAFDERAYDYVVTSFKAMENAVVSADDMALAVAHIQSRDKYIPEYLNNRLDSDSLEVPVFAVPASEYSASASNEGCEPLPEEPISLGSDIDLFSMFDETDKPSDVGLVADNGVILSDLLCDEKIEQDEQEKARLEALAQSEAASGKESDRDGDESVLDAAGACDEECLEGDAGDVPSVSDAPSGMDMSLFFEPVAVMDSGCLRLVRLRTGLGVNGLVPVVDYADIIDCSINRDCVSPEFIRDLSGSSAVCVEVCVYNGLLGLVVYAGSNLYFVLYDSAYAAALHTIFTDKNISVYTSCSYLLAVYVYWYDRNLTGVMDIWQVALTYFSGKRTFEKFINDLGERYGVSCSDRNFLLLMMPHYKEVFEGFFANLNDDSRKLYGRRKSFCIAHALSSDVGEFVPGAGVSVSDSGSFSYGSVGNGNGHGVVAKFFDFSLGDVEYNLVVLSAISLLEQGRHFVNLGIKILSISSGVVYLYADRSVIYDFLEVCVQAFSQASRKIVGNGYTFSCSPILI